MGALRFAAIGLNHDHIYGQVNVMLRAGAELVSFYADEDDLAAAFAERFPQAERVADRRRILEDRSIGLIVSAAISDERAGVAVDAMHHGKDVMLDKPGMVTLDQFEEVRRVQKETGRIVSILYSEHFETASTVKAGELVRAGAIGEVIHTTGLGPHRLRKPTRPGLVLRPAALWRHHYRHRRPPVRAVPVLHRFPRRRAAFGHRRQSRQSGFAGPAGLRRRPPAHARRHRLYPRRLVHARRPAHLGRRQALHRRHRGHDRAAQICRRRRARGQGPSVPRRSQGHAAHRLQRRRTALWAPACGRYPRSH